MSPFITEFADRTPIVEHGFGDETLERALDKAFERIGIDTMAQTDAFQDILDMDALNNLHDGSSSSPLCTVFVLYGYPVSITSEAIHIYETTSVE